MFNTLWIWFCCVVFGIRSLFRLVKLSEKMRRSDEFPGVGVCVGVLTLGGRLFISYCLLFTVGRVLFGLGRLRVVREVALIMKREWRILLIPVIIHHSNRAIELKQYRYILTYLLTRARVLSFNAGCIYRQTYCF